MLAASVLVCVCFRERVAPRSAVRCSRRHLPRATWTASASFRGQCTCTRRNVGLGASPERPSVQATSHRCIGTVTSHCIAPCCATTRWTCLPVVMLCFCCRARDETRDASWSQLSPRSVFLTRSVDYEDLEEDSRRFKPRQHDGNRDGSRTMSTYVRARFR